MAPIRVGIVGLSSKKGTWGMLAHLPRLQSSPNYQITALCNSTIANAQDAIKAYYLPPSTKAYDKYEDLANDPTIDLYIISTRADTHYSVALPALHAGKNIYCEWPLAATTAQAQEMAALARQKGVRTVVGLQGRVGPSIRKVKELVDAGVLGDVHSVNFQGAIHVWQNNAAGNKYWYFMDREVGGNLLTIYGGHVLDSLLYALGELREGAYQPLLGNLRPRMRRTLEGGQLSDELFDKDTPDQILVQGVLEREPPAVFSFHLRAGDRFKGAPGSVWRIYGTKGELVVEFASAGPQIAEATSFRFSNSETGEVQEFVIDETEEWTALPVQARNIGRLLEAYAAGEGYADWDLAVKRHQLLDEFWASGMVSGNL